MQSTVGVYENHDLAVAAVKELKDGGFPVSQVSIIGRRENIHHHGKDPGSEKITNIETAEVGIGVALGSTLGILTGVGLFAIPGFGFLFGAGALVGALAGFDIGLVGGGIVSALSIAGMKDKHKEKYDEHLRQGRYLLIIEGSEEDANRAKDILHEHAQHSELNIH